MKIIQLLGSARRKGNTATALNWAQQELISLGHEVETIPLGNKNLNGCLGCAQCKKHPDTIGCVQKDDIPDILGKMVTAQAVVFASPLYFWGVTAQLKAIIDRTYSLYTQYHQPDHASLVQGQRQAILMTGGGGLENNAQEALTAFSRLKKPHLSVHPAQLYLGGCTTPADMGDDVKNQVIEFTKKIIA